MKKDEAYVELEAMKMIMPLKVGLEGGAWDPRNGNPQKFPRLPRNFKS